MDAWSYHQLTAALLGTVYTHLDAANASSAWMVSTSTKR